MASKTISFELQGADQLQRALKALGPAAVNAAAASLYQSAEEVMTKSKEICPVLTGALRASGQVGMPDVQGSNVVVELGYGNSSIGYSVFVHENLQAHHKPPTTAKYLENPLKEAIPDINNRLVDDLNEAFDKAS